MKIDNKISEEFMQGIIRGIEQAEDKSAAIADAMEKVAYESNKDLADQIIAQAHADDEKRLSDTARGFRTLSENEKRFYAVLKAGPKARQSVDASQIDIFPTEIIDRTLADIKAESGIYSLITFAPVGVEKWLTGSATGTAAWGNLSDALAGELNATISGLNLDAHKLTAYIVIPKGIRELEVGYVDQYVTAKLEEALRDGVAAGYINGDGQKAPIGIFNQIAKFTSTGTAAAKTVLATVTGFSPKQLGPVCKTLSHGGVRAVDQLYLVANPLDVYEYVNPALYGDTFGGGYAQKSAMQINVIADSNVPQGKAAFTLAGRYTMGFSEVGVQEYKETKAMDDADLLVAKAYGNGRADDDDVAVVFDVTKLTEYVPNVINTPKTSA